MNDTPQHGLPDGTAHSDFPARLDEVTDSLTGLYESLDGQEDLDGVLSRLVFTAVRAVPDAAAASVTVATGGEHTRTAAVTDERVLEIEEQQRTAGYGPSAESAERRRPVLVGSSEQDRERWPGFTTATAAAGIAAYLSAPVYVDEPTRPENQRGPAEGTRVLGWLNLYGDTPAGFDPFDEALLRLLTTSVSAAISAADRQRRTHELVDNLQRALTSRAEIDQAKGVLMAAHSTDADTAFNRLVRESQNNNLKLATVARRLLDSVQEK